MYSFIQSTANQTVKEYRKLKEKKERYDKKRYLIEGIKLCREFLNWRAPLADAAFVTQRFLDENPAFLPENLQTYVLADHVFATLCDTRTPQGVILAANMPQEATLEFSEGPVVYLDHVADPGNVGTIIRTADAAGAGAVILSPECADLYNSKTLRSTMGSLFHLCVVYETEYLSLLKQAKQQAYHIITGSLDGTTSPYQVDFCEKTVICLGNEAHGVSEELIGLGVEKVKIPILGRAESLNVAVAGAVFLFEAVRQRSGEA